MQKTKYQAMNKEEKKELMHKYQKTETGHKMMNRLLRIRLIGVVSLVYAVIDLLVENKNLQYYDFFLIIPLFIAGLVFIIGSYHLKNKVLTKYAVKKS